jgi:hypothetical protein
MTRSVLALAVWMGLVSVASASLTPRKESLPFGKEVPQGRAAKLPARALEQVAGRETTPEFLVTDQTEIRLNGKLCKYHEVPAGASIVLIELAADQKTALKIHFRTRK